MPLPVPVPPARRARPLVATSLGEGLASGHIRQRNLGVGVSPLVPLAILPNPSLQSVSDLFFLPALQHGLPGPPLVFWASRATFGLLPYLLPHCCPSIPGHPRASTFPELSIHLLFSLCSRSGCHHITKNMRGQSSCLNR